MSYFKMGAKLLGAKLMPKLFWWQNWWGRNCWGRNWSKPVKVMNIQFKLKINNCHIFITQIGHVTVYVIKKGIIFATLYQEQASMNICKLLTQCYKFYKMSNNVTYPLWTVHLLLFGIKTAHYIDAAINLLTYDNFIICYTLQSIVFFTWAIKFIVSSLLTEWWIIMNKSCKIKDNLYFYNKKVHLWMTHC